MDESEAIVQGDALKDIGEINCIEGGGIGLAYR